MDHKHKELVAIKLVKNQKKYYYQAAVEAKLLLLLRDNDPDSVERVVRLRDYFVFRNHLCCVFDLYSVNLYEFIKMYHYQGFEYNLIRRFAIQMLSALRYLKQLGIIHCDLKPENILLKRKDKSGIVVADFGSGCLENEIVYTYIQSRFYRAPDIILGLFPYTQQIDMWSFGCIIIELYTGFPLFPGTNEREQLQLIIDVIGMPSRSVLERATRKQLFTQFKDNAVPAPLEVLTQVQKEERLSYIMSKLRDTPDAQFVDFIARCLEWDPKIRMTPEEGLQHEWIIKGLPPNILYSQKTSQVHRNSSTTMGSSQLQSSNIAGASSHNAAALSSASHQSRQLKQQIRRQ
jgi:dual specificity tyrosine-phosphorylation-regulated kinase 2/3/4